METGAFWIVRNDRQKMGEAVATVFNRRRTVYIETICAQQNRPLGKALGPPRKVICKRRKEISKYMYWR